MKTRRLGKNGPTISALGLGCMGMSEFYGPTDEAESVATNHRALDLGLTYLDTADVYGPLKNEVLWEKRSGADAKRCFSPPSSGSSEATGAAVEISVLAQKGGTDSATVTLK